MDRQTKSYTLTIFGQHIFPPLKITDTQWTKSNQLKLTWVKNAFHLLYNLLLFILLVFILIQYEIFASDMFLFVLDPMDLRAMIGSLPADST